MYELVGYRYVNIDAENKNERNLEGFSCWFLVDEPDPDFTGRSGVKVFFRSDLFPDFKPQVGDRYLIMFNQRGKLQAYQKLEG